jgi:hypothetical protein
MSAINRLTNKFETTGMIFNNKKDMRFEAFISLKV